MAAASGCSLAAFERGGEAQEVGLVSRRRRHALASRCGLPSVSVPVLSTTSVSTFSSRSSASAFLISTPGRAPRPTPTMIDIGVARPRAQGQAMISTATALTRRVGQRGCRARAAPRPRNARTATATTAGTNQPATRSASRWIGARLRWACATMLHDLGQHGLGADLARPRMTKLPVPFTVPPITAVARPLLDRHRLAGDHGLVDRAGPSSTTPSTGTLLAGADAQAVADLDLHPAAPPRRCRRRTRRAVFGARASSARIAPPVCSRARSSSTWPSSTRTVITAAASK